MSMKIPGALQFAHARVAIVGMGISGRASAQALLEHTTAELSVWDARENAVAEYRGTARVSAACAYTDNEMLARAVLEWKPTHVIIAPAFPEQGYAWKALHAAGIPVWSEIELAWQLRAAHVDGTYAPWLCITGTNGKTTTTTMTAAILAHAGLGGEAVGNVGNPAVTAISDTSEGAHRAFALELSSFQLKSTFSMQPEASICLNLADDHLEWHEGFSSYRDAKASIYEEVHIACVYPVGDADVQAMVDEADVQEGARAIGVTLGIPSVGQIGIVDGIVVDRAFHRKRHSEGIALFELDDLQHLAPAGTDLPQHIVKDALAAAALTRAIGVAPQIIKEALATFPAGHHRIEHVAEVAGVHFVDDSKATNAHAAQASLDAQRDSSVVWIAGGQPKGSRFEDLVDHVLDKLRSVIVIGVDQEPWHAALDRDHVHVPVVYIDPKSERPMEDAVWEAFGLACEGSTVLLAPACASMDQFTSYAHRGETFAAAARSLRR